MQIKENIFKFLDDLGNYYKRIVKVDFKADKFLSTYFSQIYLSDLNDLSDSISCHNPFEPQKSEYSERGKWRNYHYELYEGLKKKNEQLENYINKIENSNFFGVKYLLSHLKMISEMIDKIFSINENLNDILQKIDFVESFRWKSIFNKILNFPIYISEKKKLEFYIERRNNLVQNSQILLGTLNTNLSDIISPIINSKCWYWLQDDFFKIRFDDENTYYNNVKEEKIQISSYFGYAKFIYKLIYSNLFFISKNFVENNAKLNLSEDNIGFFGQIFFPSKSDITIPIDFLNKLLNINLEGKELLLKEIGFYDFIEANNFINSSLTSLYKQSDTETQKLFEKLFKVMSTTNFENVQPVFITSIDSPFRYLVFDNDVAEFYDVYEDKINDYLNSLMLIIKKLDESKNLDDFNYSLPSSLCGNNSKTHKLFGISYNKNLFDEYDSNKKYIIQPFDFYGKIIDSIGKDISNNETINKINTIISSLLEKEYILLQNLDKEIQYQREVFALHERYTEHCTYCALYRNCTLKESLISECNHFVLDRNKI